MKWLKLFENFRDDFYISVMMRYLGEYSKLKPEYGLDQYSHFTFTIQVY